MSLEHPNQDEPEYKQNIGEPPSLIIPISLQPFIIQLQNILPIEIIARRFSTDLPDNSHVQINLVGLDVNAAVLQAQTVWEVKAESSEDPHSFEISFKMVALFSYGKDYDSEKISQFLQQGSLSAVLPFARELLVSICTRLQIPPIFLALIQLATPSEETDVENTSKE